MSEEWYIGDPCYVVPDERWGEFCDALNKSDRGHGPFVFDGVPLEICSNGGDGSWHWGSQSFCVDAGIFTVIPMSKVEEWGQGLEARRLGIIKKDEPTLRVENGVVYINDTPDDSVSECMECGREEQHLEDWCCDSGACTGCSECFECECEEE